MVLMVLLDKRVIQVFRVTKENQGLKDQKEISEKRDHKDLKELEI